MERLCQPNYTSYITTSRSTMINKLIMIIHPKVEAAASRTSGFIDRRWYYSSLRPKISTCCIKCEQAADHATTSSSSSSRYHEQQHPSSIEAASSDLKHPKKKRLKIRKSRPSRGRGVVRVSTSSGGGGLSWQQGSWKTEYLLSLTDLQLQDLADEDQTDEKDAQVHVTLSIQKHAGFGLSIDGRVVTSFTRICSNCLCDYSEKIDTTFNVWVLPSSNRLQSGYSSGLEKLGGDDPSVIYVKPGSEAELDSLVQDAIRLDTSVKEFCSEACEKSPPKLNYVKTKKKYMDGRWSKLLELKLS